MIVPSYWAEARVQENTPERQVTVRRFGWSDAGQAEAQAHAEARAQEALARISAGETKLPRRDYKVPYNGGEGVPIREEIVERVDEMVVTRNSYGARCLNVPNVLFADIDLIGPGNVWVGCSAMLVAVLGFVALSLRLAQGWPHPARVGLAFAAFFVAIWAVSLLDDGWRKFQLRNSGRVPRRLKEWVLRNPEWHLRLYRTPAGYRVLAMQRTFEPREPAVAAAFAAWGVDRVYGLMCSNQQCFRARLTAKPWRIGLTEHMKPRPGIWPVAPERRPARARWITDYEERAKAFAACRFEEAIGSGAVAPEAEQVRAAHDRWCGAESGLPIA